MASTEDNVEVKHFSGNLSKHSVYKLNAQFAFRGSNVSLTYHLRHKHPLKNQDVADSDRQTSSEARSIRNFNKRQTFCLKVALAHWIASSDDGLWTILQTALQNQAYNLASRCIIDTVFGAMYKEKLAEHKKV